MDDRRRRSVNRATLQCMEDTWRDLAREQAGLLSRRQLRALGVTPGEVRHHVKVGRWAIRSREVVSTTTGPLSNEQRMWMGVLHGGPTAMIGGLTAAGHHGMKNWPREDITVLVANRMSFEPLAGFRFFRTRRDFKLLVCPGELPVAKIEPAVLLFAAYEPRVRTALAAVTATVQQRLTTAADLREWSLVLAPLRRGRQVRQLLDDVEGGAHSMAEVDLRKRCREYGLQPPRSQKVRYDSRGRRRYTDAEWSLPGGEVLVLEVDGAFHDDVEQATAHRRRNRRLSRPGRIVIQCSAWEVRHEPWELMADLVSLGVPRLPG